jgi:predicted  nucleic acid-binding Zn-ribbon protein
MAEKKLFTKENKESLEKISIKLLFGAVTFSGMAGAKYNVHQMMHDMSINTLKDMHSNLKTQIRKLEDSDEWTMTEYQERKLKELQDSREFVSLLIGYKIYVSQKAEAISARRELAAKIEKLKAEKMTPDEQIAALEKEMTELNSLED